MKRMKNLKYKRPVILLIVLVSWLSAYSQPSDSLMQYLEIAAKNNPEVMQKFTEYKAALQKIPQAGSLPDPELSVGVFLKPTELMMGYEKSDIRLMQMFPWFGVIRNAKDEMSLMAKVKYESFLDAKLALFYDVQRTWYELIKYQQELNISENNLEILKTIERLAIVRFKYPPASGQPSPSGRPMAQSGNSGLADLYRIRIEAGDLENSIASLKNLMSTFSVRFNGYLNRPVTTKFVIPDTLKTEIFDLSMAAASDSILSKNPLLGMLKYEAQSLDAKKRMVTRMGYPMFGLGVNYAIVSKLPYEGIPNNGNDMIMPMVTVTLPIYRKKYNAMKSEAELLKTASSQGYEATSISLQTEFYEAVQLYQDAIRRQKLYADQSELTDKSLNIMVQSFASSEVGLTDILRVRQQNLDYKFKQAEAVADYNSAVAWLKRLMAYNKEQ
jgi:outer membrane protein TolC